MTRGLPQFRVINVLLDYFLNIIIEFFIYNYDSQIIKKKDFHCFIFVYFTYCKDFFYTVFVGVKKLQFKEHKE